MKTSPRRLTATAVLLATALAGTLSSVTVADAAPARGDDAVGRAADRYDVSESTLRTRLQEDSSLRLTPNGLAYFVEPAVTSKPGPTRLTAQAFPLPDTFLLHSKPDSSKTIYLDFNGHNVSNTLWNGAPGNNLPAGDHPAMDLAGNGASFTDTELLQIQDIYQRVAEDYAPFDVDVTTEEPPATEIERANAGDSVYGTRALISPSASAFNTICGGQCGGVAFIGVFDRYTGKDGFIETHSQTQPAWVFPQGLGNDPKNIAEATTHEVGHNLGLDHDATSVQGYYAGHDSWAPIMGVAYDRPIGQFALSDYPDADLGGPNPSLQANPDDLATINAFGPADRSDEAGGTIGTAGALPSGSAYIQDRNDVDVIALGTCSGNVTVAANNAAVSPNLDIELQLLNSGGTAIDTDNPLSAFVNRDIASGMDATASGTSLPSGQYYARVDGAGRGNATTSYTDYGSIGAYTLQVSGCGGVVVNPPSAPQNLAGQDLGGGSVSLTWSAPANNGGGAITAYRVFVDGNQVPGDVPGNATGATVGGVPSGSHEFGVVAVNSAGPGPAAEVNVDVSNEEPEEAKPGKPRIGAATAGPRGGAKTAKISWRPPVGVTNPAINGYQVIAYRENNRGKFVKISTSPVFSANTRSTKFTASSGARLKFAVKARNALGFGALSAKSNAVRPR
ncbi:MAG TPA: fibronectin type III domain-containing protein [Nocardioides sp.]|nr:fibronectin type III domain-containing protein [Nocardioides sp.]